VESGVVGIDEFVIKLTTHFLQYAIEFLDVENHTSSWVTIAGEGDTKDIVMAVSVRAHAFAEGPVVLFERELGIPIPMRGFELYETSEIVHGLFFL